MKHPSSNMLDDNCNYNCNYSIILLSRLIWIFPAASAGHVPTDDDRPINMKVKGLRKVLSRTHSGTNNCVVPAINLFLFVKFTNYKFLPNAYILGTPPFYLPPLQSAGIFDDLSVDFVDSKSCPQMEMYMKNRDLIYPNFATPKGLCLIINNEKFASMPRRLGTEIDCVNLKNLFGQLDYKVIVENDLTSKEMLIRVRTFAKDTGHRFSSSAILIILTHGEKDHLLDRRDTGIAHVDQVDTAHHNTDGLFGFSKCIQRPAVIAKTVLRPRESDFLIAYATPPTYVSWRNSVRGSWFVQAICEVFAKHAHDMDILQLLTRVNQRVAECFQTNCSSSYRQMPEFHSRLIKQFYFFPDAKRSSPL
ncbi:unnamed protein product [Cylicocyclus nassatus]|uniref:Caspase-3 n=1 Tax=Cylicocyclus nassatus TaxID=53992 RepID=A0AA36DX87_CYLNA|nr:unnamed protein product [Cylicocyclus nassatus]